MKWLARFGGVLGAGLTAYEIWTWLQEQEAKDETWTDITFSTGKVALWSYDPELYEPSLSPNSITFPGVVRESGGPPLLGEYISTSQPFFPTTTTGKVQEWEDSGRTPFITSSDAVNNQAFTFAPPGQTLLVINRSITVGAEIPGAFNAKLVACFRVYRPGSASLNVRTETRPAFFRPQQGNVPWQFADFPLSSPFGAPAFPAPRPVAFAPPRLDPWSPEFPDVGPRPAPRPDANPAPWPEPWPGYDPVHNPNPQPQPQPEPLPEPVPGLGPNFGVNPRGNGAVSYTPTGARPAVASGPRPPGRGTKERKAGLPRWASFVWHAAGHITEAVDTINAVYEALPRYIKIREYKSRGRQPNPAEKLRIIYDNIGRLNMGDVVANIISENVEDTIYGKSGQALTNAGKNMFPDRPIQLGAGPAL